MRLLLASYRLTPHGAALRKLAGDGSRAGLIFNALDQYVDTRMRRLPEEQAELESVGFSCEELDLRSYFGDEAALQRRLDKLDVVWVLGGNTFVLARAMLLSGFHRVGTSAVRAGRLVYAGYSAGACVTGPDLDGIHLMDEPDVIPASYPADAPPQALGWLPWRIVPHWRSDHPEQDVADLAVEHLLASHRVFQTLSDGQAIIIDGDPSDRASSEVPR